MTWRAISARLYPGGSGPHQEGGGGGAGGGGIIPDKMLRANIQALKQQLKGVPYITAMDMDPRVRLRTHSTSISHPQYAHPT